MSDAAAEDEIAGAGEMRAHKLVFDNTWNFVTVLAAAFVVLCWHFQLGQVSVGPVIWVLSGLALVQLLINASAQHARSTAQLQRGTLTSQIAGTLLMGVAWHLCGGLQQPFFPLLIVLPLMPGALLLSFWQQQLATLALLLVLLSGVLLSPDTNSFIEERYGISLFAVHLLPSWIPRSRIAFADVSTSPAYDLVQIVTVGTIGVAVSMTARALVSLYRRTVYRLPAIEAELARAQNLSSQIINQAPYPVVIVVSGTGRIVNASARFEHEFGVSGVMGQFLLDTVSFAYPEVMRRVVSVGGEEIQGAKVGGRDVVLRVRAAVIGSGASQVTVIDVERYDEIGWRGEVDALEEPVFAVNSTGDVMFPNRAAVALFGDGVEGNGAASLFETRVARWWDIAPLEHARRILDRGAQRYIASIRRARIAPSVGELYFVQLRDRAQSAQLRPAELERPVSTDSVGS